MTCVRRWSYRQTHSDTESLQRRHKLDGTFCWLAFRHFSPICINHVQVRTLQVRIGNMKFTFITSRHRRCLFGNGWGRSQVQPLIWQQCLFKSVTSTAVVIPFVLFRPLVLLLLTWLLLLYRCCAVYFSSWGTRRGMSESGIDIDLFMTRACRITWYIRTISLWMLTFSWCDLVSLFTTQGET